MNPTVRLVISQGIEDANPILWKLGAVHPMSPEKDQAKIIAMFVTSEFVEIYAKNSTDGARDLIPISRCIYIQETMSLDVFEEEFLESLAASEGGGDDDEEGDDDDDEDKESDNNGQTQTLAQSVTPTNGN